MQELRSIEGVELPKFMIVSMPWTNAGLPSIQVGALKRYLSDRGLPITGCHWHLNVALELGLDANTAISSPNTNAAEPLYSYLLFPEMREFLLRHKGLRTWASKIEKSLKDSPAKIRFRWNEDFFQEFETFHQKLLDRYDWEKYGLVGFTLNYSQTVPSLFMAQEIKKRNPSCKIIVGGAEATGELGASLIEHFQQIDFACNGEGEIPFYQLAKAIAGKTSEERLREINGIISRGENGAIRINQPIQIESMNELEPPDYDDYLGELERQQINPQEVLREIPIEASRGCPFSCNFCSLNIQWENFRCRSPEKVNDDIRTLSKRYNALSFRFMDNLLPQNSAKLFETMADQEASYHFFFEVRAQTPPRVVRLMKKAGANVIQCGVEALSTSVLKKFNKKSRFIHNLQSMKLCEELEIETENALIANYPPCTAEDVEETARNIEYCLAYQPVVLTTYLLYSGSPDFKKREENGFHSIRNDASYRFIYPPRLYRTLNLIAKDFKTTCQMADWSPVADAVKRWKELYYQGKRNLPRGRKALLTYFDGGTFLRIEDYRGRSDGTCTSYLLNEFQRDVYLFADEITHWNALRDRFGEEGEENLKDLLEYFIDRKLMYEEDGQYLSLAMNPKLERACETTNHKIETGRAHLEVMSVASI